MISRTYVTALLGAALAFVCIATACWLVLPGASFVEAVMELDHRDRIQVYYAGGGEFSETHSAASATIEPGRMQHVRVKLALAPVRKLRLDVGNQPGFVRLRRLIVGGPFAAERVLLPEDIMRLFSLYAPGTEMRLDKDAVVIATQKDAWIACPTPLLALNPLVLWGMPLIFSLLAFAFLLHTDPASLPPFADLRGKRPSTGENLDVLDGLRAYAMILVVADHTWWRFSGVGRNGVWVFMTLSGFLLARPFVQQPGRILDPAFLSHFFARRIRRILPVYYTYVITIFLFTNRLDETLLHLLFLKGVGHLWVVPQEMLFYVLTPPVMLVSFLLFRIRPWLVPLGLALLVPFAHQLGAAVRLHGMQNAMLPLYFGVFLGGIVAAWLHSLWQEASPELRRRVEPWAARLTVLLALFLALRLYEQVGTSNRYYTLIYGPWFALAAAVLLLAALTADRSSVPARILAWMPLRALSLVSFSIYIFHPLLLEVIRKAAVLYSGWVLTGWQLFLFTLLASYLFACITYSLLERPFLRSQR